jgi:hypothetical protein
MQVKVKPDVGVCAFRRRKGPTSASNGESSRLSFATHSICRWSSAIGGACAYMCLVRACSYCAQRGRPSACVTPGCCSIPAMSAATDCVRTNVRRREWILSPEDIVARTIKERLCEARSFYRHEKQQCCMIAIRLQLNLSRE